MNKNNTEQTTVLILSGGRGSRLSDTDKGLIKLANKPLVQHVIDSLPQAWPIIISANRNLDAYRTLGYNCISDPDDDFVGPMAAILTSLAGINTHNLLVLPCDTPFLPSNLAETLVAALSSTHAASYAQHQQRGHYCCMAAELSALRQLQTAPRSMYQLLTLLDATPVQISADSNAFLNINTAEDLADAERLLKNTAQTKKP